MSEAVDQIGRRKALVRNGWLPELSGLELKVLDYYEYCANPDGSNAHPSLETIAKATGANPGHIRVARVLLVQFELLARQDDGRGGRTTATFCVLSPPRAKRGVGKRLRDEERRKRRSGRGTQMEGGSNGAGVKRRSAQKEEGSKARAQGELEARAQGGSNARAPSKEDQSLYQSHHHLSATAAPPAGDGAAGADVVGTIAAVPPAKPRRAEPKNPAEYRQFTDHWCVRWAEIHGFKFEFQTTDGVMLSEIWRRCAQNLDVATATLDAYLADRAWIQDGHPTTKLKQNAQKYIKRAHQSGAGVGYGPIKLDGNTKPGEFASDLPVGVRTYREPGGGAAAAG